MYANSEEGALSAKGALNVNGDEAPGSASRRLTEGLLSVGQMDVTLGATTIFMDGKAYAVEKSEQ